MRDFKAFWNRLAACIATGFKGIVSVEPSLQVLTGREFVSGAALPDIRKPWCGKGNLRVRKVFISRKKGKKALLHICTESKIREWGKSNIGDVK